MYRFRLATAGGEVDRRMNRGTDDSIMPIRS